LTTALRNPLRYKYPCAVYPLRWLVAANMRLTCGYIGRAGPKMTRASGAAGATAPMASVDLAKRMAICESVVLNGVIDPLVMGSQHNRPQSNALTADHWASAYLALHVQPEGAVRPAPAPALKAQVSTATSRYVALCRAAGIPVRDIAFLLGITPQRVSQIGLKDDDD
jgi:hypothetical protein